MPGTSSVLAPSPGMIWAEIILSWQGDEPDLGFSDFSTNCKEQACKLLYYKRYICNFNRSQRKRYLWKSPACSPAPASNQHWPPTFILLHAAITYPRFVCPPCICTCIFFLPSTPPAPLHVCHADRYRAITVGRLIPNLVSYGVTLANQRQ